MGAILKITLLVCFAFTFLAPAPVEGEAIHCLHCVSKNLTGTNVEDCIKAMPKFENTMCEKGNHVCEMIDIKHEGRTNVVRGCVIKSSLYTKPCCTMFEDTAAETKVSSPIPYFICYCDWKNCNNQTGGSLSMDKMPDGYEKCPLPPVETNTTTTTAPVSKAPETNSQGPSRASSLSVLNAICLTVLVIIPAVVSHDNLQY